MKRIIKVGIISSVIFLMLFANISIYATTENSNNPSAKKEIVIDYVGENQIQITVSLKHLLGIGEGINAYTGVLKFNPNELEFVNFINVNSWNNPTYKISDNELKVVSTSNEFIKEENIIFKAVFYKKVTKDSYDVQISDLELAAKVNGKTLKVIANDNSTEEVEIIATKDSPMMIIIVCFIIIVAIAIIYIVSKKFKEEK